MFCSAIEGFSVKTLCPKSVAESSEFQEKTSEKRHLIFTAETHNFPTGKLCSVLHDKEIHTG